MRNVQALAAMLVAASLVSACAATGSSRAPPPPAGTAPTTLYVARRSWHIDVGFAVQALSAPLAAIASREFPRARYVFFGFGDRHYLLSKDRNAPLLLEALWPGPGLILVTEIEVRPAQAFGAANVVEIPLEPGQALAVGEFIGQSLAHHADGTVAPSGQGPYEGSAYFDAVARYSGFHTCITWAAEALRSAGLPIRSRFTLVAGQLWHQVLRLRQPAASSLRAAAAEPSLAQSHGGGLPFWQITVVPLPCGTTTVVLAGAGGLLLLMQPASNPAAHTALNSTFMSDSCSLGTSHIAKRILRFRHSAWQKRSARGSVVPCPTVRRSSRAHPVDGSADYWIYRAPAAA